MTQNPRQDDGHAPDDAHDEAVGRLINEFFDRRESGELISEAAFIAEHQEYADDLREHLAGLNIIRGIGSSSADDQFAANQTRSAQISRRRDVENLDDIHIPEIPGYDIQRPLGRGGMGIVYKAIQRSTGRQVALKVLLEGPFAAAQARKRFEREITLSAQLRHANIIPIYDSGRSEGRLYYAMEYVRGLPLNEYVRQEKPSVTRKLELMAKVAEALRHAHQRGVIHRDLKPSNILVRADGEPQLLDFGLAKQGTYSDMTTSLTAQIIGTPAYMSPEQAAGDPTGIDQRTDIYSLGVVLFEVLSDQMPYATNVSMGELLNNIARAEPDESHLVVAGIDPGLIAICLKALEKNTEQRYQSVDALIADITHYLADEPISVRPATSMWLLRKSLWKHRVGIGILVVAAMLFGGSAVVLHRITQVINEKQEQIALRDEQLEAQLELDRNRADELRRREEQLRRQQVEVDLYRKILGQLDPRAAAAAMTFTKTMSGDLAAVPDLMMNVAASEMEKFIQPEKAAVVRGKDLEAGIREMPLEGINPDRLVPRRRSRAPRWLQALESLFPEQPAQVADAPAATTRPAEVADGRRATTQTAGDPTAAGDAMLEASASDRS